MLSARKVASVGPGKAVDRAGLMLVVKASGARSWVLRCQAKGQRRDIGLGSWPEVTLAVARQKSLDARRLMREGVDPVAMRRRRMTRFGEVAEGLIESRRD